MAVVGVAFGIALTPFMDGVWAYQPGIDWSQELLLNRAFGPILDRAGLLDFRYVGFPYKVYGKGFFLVYLLIRPLVRSQVADAPASRRVGRVISQALSVAMVSDFLSYWGISVPGVVGQVLWSGGFMIELLAIVVLIPTTFAFGVIYARSGDRLRGLALIAIAPLIVVLSVWITRYLPNSAVVPIAIGWTTVGVLGLSRPDSQPEAQRLTDGGFPASR